MANFHEQARQAVSSLADEAMDTTLANLYKRFPELYRRFGVNGQRACRDDLRFHIDYLDGALASEDGAAFGDYIAWLAGVLESRGVPTASLGASIELLDGFFASRLPADIATPVAAVLAAGAAALSAPPASLPARPLSPSAPAHRQVAALAQMLVANEREDARTLLADAAAEGLGYLELGVLLFQPALYRIGELWRENRISVAQEHLATALTQNFLAEAYGRAEFAPPRQRQVLCACVAGNRHALGLRLTADAFETAGWEAIHLGADVPTRDLVTFADRQPPALIALSVATTFQVGSLRAALTELRGELGNRCPPILVGGLAANALPDLWRRLGADEWRADALAVAALARE